MLRLEHATQYYDWGSPRLVPDLLGSAADGRPVAEIWFGAHPLAPSTVVDGPDRLTLDAYIARDPAGTLGPRVLESFGGQMPFLLKVLGVAQPLSIQVHPDRSQAERGHSREDAAGLPVAHPTRNYKDRGHKPEMLYALSRFEILAGVRPADQACDLLLALETDAVDDVIAALRGCERAGTEQPVFARALTGGLTRMTPWRQVRDAAVAHRHLTREIDLVAELADLHPGDPAVLAPLLLNYAVLEPGEAAFVGAGTVHCYVSGLGVEVMASSDNVLRAGLTSKHVDVAELLEIADFHPSSVHRVAPEGEPRSVRFRTPVPDFALEVLAPAGTGAIAGATGGPRAAFCVEGEVAVAAGGQRRALRRGEAVFVPDADGALAVSGRGRLVVAYVPEAA